MKSSAMTEPKVTIPLKDIVVEVARTKAFRRPSSRDDVISKISDCRFYMDGPYTFVVIDTESGQFVGSAKFNPADVKKMKRRTRTGKVVERLESKYSDFAGLFRAVHRATDKLLYDI